LLLTHRTLHPRTLLALLDPDAQLNLRTHGARMLRRLGAFDARSLLNLRTRGTRMLGRLLALHAGALLDLRAWRAGTLLRPLRTGALRWLRAFAGAPRFAGIFRAAALGLVATATATLGLRRRGNRQSGDGSDQENLGHRSNPANCA
jgi:hypothetical protein